VGSLPVLLVFLGGLYYWFVCLVVVCLGWVQGGLLFLMSFVDGSGGDCSLLGGLLRYSHFSHSGTCFQCIFRWWLLLLGGVVVVFLTLD